MDEVLICGGGLAGGSLALQLLRAAPDLRLTVLERRADAAPEAAFKVGESTVEIGAHYLREVLGLGDHLAAAQLPKFGLRYFFTGRDAADFGSRLEFGGAGFWEVRSHQVDRGRLENEILARVRAAGGRVVLGATVRRIEPDAQGHRVELADGSHHAARFLVDASGRKGLLKAQLGLAEPVDHPVNAVWWRLPGRVAVGDWCRDPTWRARVGEDRWLSTNHLMGSGYWVWLIPLAGGQTSLGIVADERQHPLAGFNSYVRALAWLAEHEPACAAACREAGEPLDFLAIRHFAHGCRRLYDQDWAIVGEAGLFLDPFYSPGSDFIAMANTFTADLILRRRAGEPIALRARLYEDLHQRLFGNWLGLYRDRYCCFGNGRVMLAKIAWDFAWYWSVPAAFVFAGRLTDLEAFARHRALLDELSALNDRVQELFQTWHDADGDPAPAGFIAIDGVPWLRRLNEGLRDTLDDPAFDARLARRAAELQRAADEIAAEARRRRPGLGWPSSRPSAAPLLGELFAALQTSDDATTVP